MALQGKTARIPTVLAVATLGVWAWLPGERRSMPQKRCRLRWLLEPLNSEGEQRLVSREALFAPQCGANIPQERPFPGTAIFTPILAELDCQIAQLPFRKVRHGTVGTM